MRAPDFWKSNRWNKLRNSARVICLLKTQATRSHVPTSAVLKTARKQQFAPTCNEAPVWKLHDIISKFYTNRDKIIHFCNGVRHWLRLVHTSTGTKLLSNHCVFLITNNKTYTATLSKLVICEEKRWQVDDTGHPVSRSSGSPAGTAEVQPPQKLLTMCTWCARPIVVCEQLTRTFHCCEQSPRTHAQQTSVSWSNLRRFIGLDTLVCVGKQTSYYTL